MNTKAMIFAVIILSMLTGGCLQSNTGSVNEQSSISKVEDSHYAWVSEYSCIPGSNIVCYREVEFVLKNGTRITCLDKVGNAGISCDWGG